MSFPKYPEYKDSGVEWLGEVPGHWDIQKLKRIASFSGGGTPSRDNPAFWNGDIPWVSPKDMKSEEITTTEECITPLGLQSNATNVVPPGTVILVVRSGILRHTIPIAITKNEVALNQDMKAIHLDPGSCSGKFFLRWVQGLNDHLLLSWGKQGATVESIEHEYLSNSILPLPLVEEQTTIAAFLDHETAKIDALITEQEKLIELLKEKRQAVISHAVTKGLDPNVPMKDSGMEWLGEVPEHWEISPVKYLVASFEQGWSPQCENFPVETESDWGVLKVGCVNGGVFNPQENKALPNNLEPQPALGVLAGDVLISRANTKELVGSAAVVLEDYPNLLLCDKLYRVRVKQKRLISEYLSLFIGTFAARSVIELSATGASSSMQNIGQGVILNLSMPVPPVDEQKLLVLGIQEKLAPFGVLIAEAQRTIDLLKERRSALISAAVTGKIDVRGFAPVSEAV